MTTYEKLMDELQAVTRQYQGLVSRSQRAPLIARAEGIKAQLRAYNVFSFAGYGKGSTNGQRRQAQCIVVTKQLDKNGAKIVALNQMRTYKALGSKHPHPRGAVVDVGKLVDFKVDLFKLACPIIEY